MDIKTTTTYNITFSVRAFWNEEGGMGEDWFGKPVSELPEAIHLLELARVSQPNEDWIIACDVKTKTFKN